MSKTYCFEADGAMKKGLLTAGDKQYYLDEKMVLKAEHMRVLKPRLIIL